MLNISPDGPASLALVQRGGLLNIDYSSILSAENFQIYLECTPGLGAAGGLALTTVVDGSAFTLIHVIYTTPGAYTHSFDGQVELGASLGFIPSVD